MDLEDVFAQIGGYGSSQKKVVYILGTSHAFLSFNILILSFIGSEPEWNCSGGSSNQRAATGAGVSVRQRVDADCLAYERGECTPLYNGDESSSIVAEVN